MTTREARIQELREAMERIRTDTAKLTTLNSEGTTHLSVRSRPLSVAITEIETGLLWLERAVALYTQD